MEEGKDTERITNQRGAWEKESFTEEMMFVLAFKDDP